MPWSTAFDDPVPLPSGRALFTLAQAARYIQKLPGAEQRRAHWHTATEILIAAAEGRDSAMHARIALLKALNHGRPAPAPAPRRKPARVHRIIR